jgi:parvulin-like peptidyl-prolyl isomerase
LHIIKVTGRDSREVKIASIVSRIKPSSQTKNDITERAKDFAYNAKKEDLVKEAQATGLEAKDADMTEKMAFIPGVGMNESVSKWAFDNKVGSVSEPYTIPNGWAVFSVAAVKNAGVKPFDEIKDQIQPQVVRKKKIDRLKQVAADYRSKLAPADSLSKLESMNPSIKVQRTGSFTLTSGPPGVGRDQQFLGGVLALSPGQISAPVSSLRGIYLIQLLSKVSFDSTAYAAQREMLRSQMLQEKRNRYVSEWLAKLKENADIEDNRDKFYR